jgi:hypothetical protein
LLAGPTTANASSEAVIDYANPKNLANSTTNASSTWTTHGVIYAAGASNLAEGAVVKILLPEGASYTDNNGNQNPIWTGIAVRYIELDSGGSPITTSPVGDLDGYVRLRPFEFYRKYSAGVSYDIQFPLYDPQTYVRSALRGYASFNSAGVFQSVFPYDIRDPYLTRTGLTVPSTGPEWTSTSTCESVSVECFYYLRSLRYIESTESQPDRLDIREFADDGSWIVLADNAGSIATAGFALGTASKTYVPAPGQSVVRQVPRLRFAGVDFYEQGLDASYLARCPGGPQQIENFGTAS